MKKAFSDSLRDFALLALASLVLGLLLLIFPDTSARLISILCAVVLVVYGGIHVVLYFFRKSPDDLFRHDFAKGLICLLAGLYLLFNPHVLMAVLPFVLGLVVVADSIIKLQKAFDLVRLGSPHWWVVLLLAIATAILGVLMLLNPFRAAASLMMFIGIGLVVNGVSDLWTVISLRRWVKAAVQTVKEAVSGIETTGRVEEAPPEETGQPPEA